MNPVAAAASQFLEQVESRLEQALRSESEARPSTLLAAARNLCLGNGAKRVRPRLVQLLGQAVGAEQAALVDVAVAGELIHSGSLLHDDVIDGGVVRRDRPTANARWGNIAAVLAGDLCLTLAFVQIREHPMVLTTEAVDTIEQMTRAAMDEAESRGRLELSLQGWRRMVEGKTGALFAWCGRCAARVAEAPDAIARFTDFGLHLGVAFQMTDDLLDLVGGSKKDRFSDIRNREPSYPLLMAATESGQLRRRLEAAWAGEAVTAAQAQELGEAVVAGSAFGHTIDRIRSEVEAALKALGPYAATPSCGELAWWARGLARRASGG
jgi:octaprenyl-diphosphate synthase